MKENHLTGATEFLTKRSLPLEILQNLDWPNQSGQGYPPILRFIGIKHDCTKFCKMYWNCQFIRQHQRSSVTYNIIHSRCILTLPVVLMSFFSIMDTIMTTCIIQLQQKERRVDWWFDLMNLCIDYKQMGFSRMIIVFV